ncbi:MAG: hypothetical protein FJ217_07720 [Ignavibacteria bacterium]|nr:hypothetical protein [Ignavibacteria bacterium]
MEKKELMWAISVSLSKPEAIQFAKSLDGSDRYYLLKISENPKARHIAKRERFIVVRYPHNGKTVPNGHAVFVCVNELQLVEENE